MSADRQALDTVRAFGLSVRDAVVYLRTRRALLDAAEEATPDADLSRSPREPRQ